MLRGIGALDDVAPATAAVADANEDGKDEEHGGSDGDPEENLFPLCHVVVDFNDGLIVDVFPVADAADGCDVGHVFEDIARELIHSLWRGADEAPW